MKVRLTHRGQMTLPKRFRDALGVQPGDDVDVEEEDGRVVVRRHFDKAKFLAAIEEWHGVLGHLPEGKTVDDLVREMRGH